MCSDNDYNNFDTENSDDKKLFYINVDAIEKQPLMKMSEKIEMLDNGEENIIMDVAAVEVAKYDFNLEGINYNGRVFASPYSNESVISNKIHDISNSIDNDTFFDNHQSFGMILKSINSLNVDSNWKVLNEEKIDVVVETEGHDFYGDFSEWRTVFNLKNSYNEPEYYAFLNETYIKPNPKKTDYRTSQLIYEFNPTLGVEAELRDYGPKARKPEATVGYSVSAGSEVSDSGASISSSISASYSTIIRSPKVYDEGNMARNIAEIRFEYLKPFDNGGTYYEYNIGQSFQSSVFVIKADRSSDDIVISDDRVVSIQRDGLWSNTLLNYSIDTNLRIIR